MYYSGLSATTTSKPFSHASWGRLDVKPNRNKRKPKQEGEGKKRVN
jgi:hypothetical protein